ncbi:hypothetical protein OSTOST_04955, partial [Ostertagia ostertagi]
MKLKKINLLSTLNIEDLGSSKRNANVLDSVVSRRIAAQFKCHGVTASRLTNYARRVKRRLRSSHSSESVAIVDLDDVDNGIEDKFEERFIKSKDLEELKQIPSSLPIDMREGSNDLVLFNYLFMQFLENTHQMHRVRVPDVDPCLLRRMAFEGKRNISDIGGDHLSPLELRKVCNALASTLHMYRNQ